MLVTTPCVRWEGLHRRSDGRPLVGGSGPDRKRYAYRWLWEQAHGSLSRGVILHHLCENHWCVALDHLEPMTQGEHKRRHGLVGDQHQSKKTHCPAGHRYTKSNTYVYRRKNGTTERHCKKCRLAHKRNFRARRRAA